MARRLPSAELKGLVIKGAGLGRRIGVPTANLKVSPSRRLPRGVFKVRVEGRAFPAPRTGVCNVGVRPTIGGSKARSVEVHIPGFRGDLYGKTLRVSFIGRIRAEKRFPSLSALKRQIRRDIKSVQEDA